MQLFAAKGSCMSYQAKVDAALALIQKHNEVIGAVSSALPGVVTPNPGFINPTDFVTMLKVAGYHEEQHLNGMSQEELLELFPAYKGIKPKILAKEISKVFRDKPAVEAATSNFHPVSEKKAQNMSIKELIERLDVEEPTSSVAERLKKIVNNRPFIIFNNGRIVDVENTFQQVNAIRTGYPAVEIVNIGGEPKKVYPLGELPENYADENPLYHNRPLRPDGSCDQTGRSWSGVSLPVRQLVYLAVHAKEIDVTQKNGIMVAHDVINIAVGDDAVKKFRSIYSKIALKYDELAKTGNLPTLKIALGGKNNRPFPEGNKVDFVELREKYPIRSPR